MTDHEQIEAAKEWLLSGDEYDKEQATYTLRRVQELEDWRARALPYLRTYRTFDWLDSSKPKIDALIAEAKEQGK